MAGGVRTLGLGPAWVLRAAFRHSVFNLKYGTFSRPGVQRGQTEFSAVRAYTPREVAGGRRTVDEDRTQLQCQCGDAVWCAMSQGGATKILLLLAVVVLTAQLLNAGAAWAGPLDDAAAAAQHANPAGFASFYRQEAEKGNAIAQANLGLMYENGEGVTQDYGEAVKWYRLSAAQGNAGGQSNLGRMYANGQECHAGLRRSY